MFCLTDSIFGSKSKHKFFSLNISRLASTRIFHTPDFRYAIRTTVMRVRRIADVTGSLVAHVSIVKSGQYLFLVSLLRNK